MSDDKKTKESDPLFWGNLCLLAGAFIAIPLSYAFQPQLLRQSESLGHYTGQAFVALPNLFDEWPGGQGLKLAAGNEQSISIEDVDSSTAADLGLTIAAAAGTTPGYELRPRASALNRLTDLGGAMDKGIRLGSVKILIDSKDPQDKGIPVDLHGCQTLGDVVKHLNDEIEKAQPGVGLVGIKDFGLTLTAAAGHKIRIENGDSTMAGAPLDPDSPAATQSATASAPSGMDAPTAVPSGGPAAGSKPDLTAATLLAGLPGATGQGIRLTRIKLQVDSSQAVVDLSKAQTAGDVVEKINKAIKIANDKAGEIAIQGRGFVLKANANHNLRIGATRLAETGKDSTTAADLGIAVTANGLLAADLGVILTAQNSTERGVDLGPKAVAGTLVSDLSGATGWGIRPGSVKVTVNGRVSTVDLREVQTLKELVDKVNQAVPGSAATVVEPNDATKSDELLGQIQGVLSTGAASREGQTPGTVRITVRGKNAVVDLRPAQTLGQAVEMINKAVPEAKAHTPGLAVAGGDSLTAAGDGTPVRLTLGLASAGALALGIFGSMRRNRQRRLGQPFAALTASTSPDSLKVGTLTYTKVALVTMFCWILWGDFCFTLMERIFPTIMPLQLKNLGASNTWISVLVVTLPNILNFTLVPIISFKSDRYRSKWGRRIPFIAVTAPFLCLFLVLLGYSQDIGTFIQNSSIPDKLHVSPVFLTLTVISLLVVGYKFFDMFVNSVYWYLFADVVPQAYMARFVGMFNLVGSLAGMLFSTFVYGYAEEYTSEIYWGAAVLYFFGFGLMCWRLKEGQYPPVTDVGPRKGRFDAAKVYFRECFTHPLFLCMFSFNALWAVTNACNALKIFYNRDYVGLSLKQMGLIGGVLGLLNTSLCYIVGWVVDRVHPVRTLLIATVGIIPLAFAGALVHDYYSYLLVAVLITPIVLLFDASTMPMMLRLLPRERYGQFASANAMMRSAANIVGPIAGGLFADYMTYNGTYLQNYRYTYYWQAGFMIPALAALLFVFFYWKKHGGAKAYVPPDTTVPAEPRPAAVPG